MGINNLNRQHFQLSPRPYPSQLDFMACVYDTLEIGGVGILDPWKATEGSSIAAIAVLFQSLTHDNQEIPGVVVGRA